MRIVENDGAIVSEYLPSDLGTRISFLRRNELQAALSKIVIPIECPILESGTGATIRRAGIIKTPVVGISMNSNLIDEKNLVTTRENLIRLGFKVFSLNNGGQSNFLEYLVKALPEHNWGDTDFARQNRFFRFIEKEIQQAKNKIELDSAAIDRLAEHLKRNI